MLYCEAKAKAKLRLRLARLISSLSFSLSLCCLFDSFSSHPSGVECGLCDPAPWCVWAKGATSPWAVRPSVLRGFEGLPTTWVRPSLPPGTILVVGGEFPSGLGKRVLGYFGQTRKRKIKLYLAAPRSGVHEGGIYWVGIGYSATPRGFSCWALGRC